MTYADMICREIHEAGWSYGIMAAIFPKVGLLFVADASNGDGHRYVAQAETELGALMKLQIMLGRVDASENGCAG